MGPAVSAGPAQMAAKVVIVGGGPAGLRAATALAGHAPGEVLVLERESVAGGIPRHCAHAGFGLRDLGRFLSGPRYAEVMVSRAIDAGARIMTSSMATGWAGERCLQVTTPAGRLEIHAEVIILATGARERPRAARLVPGSRCSGVLTTGELQSLVHLKHQAIGSRAVIVGSELVSWSAVLTLRDAGCRRTLLVTESPRSQAYAVASAFGRIALRTPLRTQTRLIRVIGDREVTAVEVERQGERDRIPCDTVIFTGDWIPDHELARAAGLPIDAASKSPIVDTALQTPRDGIFAIGNLVHPVDTADVAALDGAAVAPAVLARLAGKPVAPSVLTLTVEPPLRWIAPSRIAMDDPHPPRGRYLAWSDELRLFPRVVATQDGRVIGSRQLPWPCAPGRMFRIPATVLGHADPAGSEVRIHLA